MRDGSRRLRAGLWGAVAVGIVASASVAVIFPGHHSDSALSVSGTHRGEQSQAADKVTAARIMADLNAAAAHGQLPLQTGSPIAAARAATQQLGQTETAAAQQEGLFVPAGSSGSVVAVPPGEMSGGKTGQVIGKLGKLRPADLLVVAPTSLPRAALRMIRHLHGVAGAEAVDAARIKINGAYVAMLGVKPSTFREYAAKPTARATALWQNVAGGRIIVSYLMGQQEKLPLGGTIGVTGTTTKQLRVGGFGTVGIDGVDAVVSDSVARSLGMPAGNAIVISAPRARLSTLMHQLKLKLPKHASVTPLVAQAVEHGLPVTAGSAGAIGVTAADGPGLTVPQTRQFLTVALDQVGKRYVWGGAGPNVFDCSGLVQWSMRHAGIVMPRVAVNQAQTGPQIPVSELEPGDLLFYHTDPTAPTYISHVAIYLGDGLMEQAPEPGMDVEIVPAIFGQGFAGAVRVYPRVAAAVAANSPG